MQDDLRKPDRSEGEGFVDVYVFHRRFDPLHDTVMAMRRLLTVLRRCMASTVPKCMQR